jgi:L-ascorbate metabolism protein UlaG (beta-lactamase superfamily)
VLEPARHLAALFRFLLHRRSQERHDADAVGALAADGGAALGLPAGLELEWLGTSGYRLRYAGTTLLIDPYLTRVPLRDVLLRRATPSDPALVERYIDAASAVLVGHTHFDHALDAPAIAARFGCKAYGSASLGRLMQLHGRPELGVEVEPYRTYEIGPFAVSFVPSAHSRLNAGLSVPFDGDISCDHLDALVPSAYCCGQVWGIHIAVAGITLYHQGSANLIDDAVRHRGVDVLLCGISGRRFTRDFAARLLPRLEPRVIVPGHYDDFFRPLDRPMGYSLNVNVAAFPEEVRRVSRDFAIHTLTPMIPVRGGTLGGAAD